MSTVKNICFFNSVPFWGGGEKFYFEYALAMREKGYNVWLFCSPGSVLEDQAKAHNLNFFTQKVRMLSVLNPAILKRTTTFFKQKQIDTVIFSTSQDLKLGGLAAKRAGVPQIIYRRGLATPIKKSITNKYLLGKVLTKILANSEETKRTIRQNFSDLIPPEKITVIYNGIDIDKIGRKVSELHPTIVEKRKGIVLGNAGRLTIQKGQHLLLDVMEHLKKRNLDCSLFIAGTGELEAELKAQITARGLTDDVHLLGFVEDIPQFMASLDVFILSSAWEGFGYVLAEAMIQAKPVVAFDITSNPEIINPDKTGFLVPHPDTTAMTSKVAELIEDNQLRNSMGQAGVEWVQSKFDIRQQFDAFEAFLLR